MFQISGDAIAGIVVGFMLGLIVYRMYNRVMYSPHIHLKLPSSKHVALCGERRDSAEITENIADVDCVKCLKNEIQRLLQRLLYDVMDTAGVEDEEESIKETLAKQQAAEPQGKPNTNGRSCQRFTSAMNIDSTDRCQYLNQVTGYCNLFTKSLFILGGKYERCAECKEKYPEK